MKRLGIKEFQDFVKGKLSEEILEKHMVTVHML